MIDLYTADTPNGLKLVIALEELALPYRRIRVDLGAGEQHGEAFRAISPNGKIPAMVDLDPPGGGAPIAVFESGAMLVYLAERCGRLLPSEPRARAEVLQWLFWQVGGLGPMAGQAGHFRAHARDPVPYAIERYTREVGRLFGVLDYRLRGRDAIAGDGFSVADIACYPWVAAWRGLGQEIGRHPDLERWFADVGRRPAVVAAYAGVAAADPYAAGAASLSAAARQSLFGATTAGDSAGRDATTSGDSAGRDATSSGGGAGGDATGRSKSAKA